MALNRAVVFADRLVADDADPFAGSELGRSNESNGPGPIAHGAPVADAPIQLGRPADRRHIGGDRFSTYA